MCESFVYHPLPPLSCQSALFGWQGFKLSFSWERCWKEVKRSHVWLMFPRHKELNNTRYAMWNWKAQCPKARALSSTLNYFCKDRNCGAQSVAFRLSVCLVLLFVSYIWKLDGKTAQWHIWNISFQKKIFAPQCKRHCVTWQKKKGVSFSSAEAHGASIARFHRRRFNSPLLRHLKSLMQIALVLFSHRVDGLACLPVGLFVKMMIWFFKGSQMEGFVNDCRLS